MSYKTSTTTSSNVHANTRIPDASDTFTIAGVVISVLVILLVILGIIFWKKKKLFGMQNTITIIATYISISQFHEK